jgi:hypothetical protein
VQACISECFERCSGIAPEDLFILTQNNAALGIRAASGAYHNAIGKPPPGLETCCNSPVLNAPRWPAFAGLNFLRQAGSLAARYVAYVGSAVEAARACSFSELLCRAESAGASLFNAG